MWKPKPKPTENVKVEGGRFIREEKRAGVKEIRERAREGRREVKVDMNKR